MRKIKGGRTDPPASYDIVVQMHNGSLRVESEEGRYAEFIVTLPKTTSE